MRLNRSSVAAIVGALCVASAAPCASPPALGVVVQEDAHPPHPWRKLTAAEQAKFDFGYAVFNTAWSPANAPAGRTDGLGPLFNVQSCDACHNSRRRGRGPRGDGDAPGDLVIQLGKLLPDGRVERGIPEYGRILNTAATAGFTPEASVSIRYQERPRWLVDGTKTSLRVPSYVVSNLSGPPLPAGTVIMPRMPPLVQGSGLLERVPEAALTSLVKSEERESVSGHISRVNGSTAIGRFGWQATEPTVASQTASAFVREMGLTSALASHIDCGEGDGACLTAPNGGTPEVDPALFDALIWFQTLHAVPIAKAPTADAPGARLFAQVGCASCHRPTLPVETDNHAAGTITAYTDLLLHDLGDDLADHDVSGRAVHSEWRTAPLWGLGASVATGQPLHLLHDGRARSVEEAILWHGGAAANSLGRYLALDATEREALEKWIGQR